MFRKPILSKCETTSAAGPEYNKSPRPLFKRLLLLLLFNLLVHLEVAFHQNAEKHGEVVGFVTILQLFFLLKLNLQQYIIYLKSH